MIRSLVLSCLVLLLSSCGFQLRGSTPVAPPLQTLYLKTADPYGKLADDLRDYLTLSGIQLVDTPGPHTTVLDILRETQSQQLINVSGTQQTRQYNLVLTVVFQLTKANGQPWVPLQSLSETRAFTTVSNQILGGTNEQSTLIEQMRQALVFDIMNRLGSQDITHLLTEKR